MQIKQLMSKRWLVRQKTKKMTKLLMSKMILGSTTLRRKMTQLLEDYIDEVAEKFPEETLEKEYAKFCKFLNGIDVDKMVDDLQPIMLTHYKGTLMLLHNYFAEKFPGTRTNNIDNPDMEKLARDSVS